MTLSQLLNRLPVLQAMFPREIEMEWSLAEYLIAYQEQEERTLAGLDAWREQSPNLENDHS